MNQALEALIYEAAPKVPWPKGVDGVKLLKALSIVESSGGTNSVPRHEDSWCPNTSGLLLVRAKDSVVVVKGGANVNSVVRARFALWGCGACCSYSPFQIHYQTAADRGFPGPPNTLNMARVAMDFVILELTRQIHHFAAGSVEELGDGWNSGNCRDSNTVPGYRQKLVKAYST